MIDLEGWYVLDLKELKRRDKMFTNDIKKYDSDTPLKVTRIHKGLSRRDVAKACEVSTNTVQCWELGTRKPSLENLLKLAKVLKISMEELTKMII